MPCGQCISSKTSACQYSSDPPPQSKRPRVGGNSQYPVTPSTVGHNSPENATNASPNFNAITGSATNGMPIVSTNFWTDRTPIVEGPIPVRGQAIALPQKTPDPLVQALVDRVHKLEQIISDSETLNNNSSIISSSYIKGPSLRGSLSKTRFFGQSHWMNSFEQFKHMSNFKELGPLSKGGEIFDLLNKCKALGRKAKEYQSAESPVPSGYRDFVPEKEISDRLVNAYFRTFESVYRILHIPTFDEEYEEYWKNPPAASMAFVIKLLLVMAIGTCFYEDPILPTSLRPKAQHWIAAAQAWVSAPSEKHRLNIVGLQIHCLLLIARQVNAVGGDLTWISAGSDYDTELPANIDDSEIIFRSETPYEETLRLDTTLSEASRSSSALLQSFLTSNSEQKPTPFQIKIHDFFTNHFLLALHRPYAVKAKVNPTYYFSRKVCLETSLSLLGPAITLPGQSDSGQPDDWTLLTWTASGLIKGNYIHAYIGLGLELNQQLEENPPLPLSIKNPPPQQVELLRTLSTGRDWSTNRILRGDTNIKGHVFISCLCGQIEALQKAASTEEGIITEARKSVEHCFQLMKNRLRDQEAKISAEVNRNLSIDTGLDNLNWDAVVMQDPGVDFELPGEWVFSGWEDSNLWY
ncbi:hypothetical protein DID88_000130 [Monilinia fructigena]|uniref:Xylanolytic transcriptional activator regulatory domain-containing protein n=1 Tax=Monilinia fructigena TaxID=38457 RepID=A0A395IKH5_9HELO|nr:hypothetical protein DID88_000130 [Monilinia fructigena]